MTHKQNHIIYQGINLAIKYLKFVIPAKAGIQRHYWMPDQARHDGLHIFSCRVNNSVISVEPHPDYSQPVVVKKPFKRQPSQRILRSLEKEFEMTRSLDAVEGVRKAIGKQSIGNQPALILEYIDGVTLRDHINE